MPRRPGVRRWSWGLHHFVPERVRGLNGGRSATSSAVVPMRPPEPVKEGPASRRVQRGFGGGGGGVPPSHPVMPARVSSLPPEEIPLSPSWRSYIRRQCYWRK